MRKPKWTRQKIVRRIKQWHRAGVPIGKLYLKDPAMASSAGAIFGSWRAALREAGLESERQTWSRDRTIREMRRCHREGKPFSSKLNAAAIRYFGSLRKARAAAGTPARQRPSAFHSWTKAKVCAEIQERYRSGGSLSLKTTCREYPALYAAAKRLFGSWTEARAVAGHPRSRTMFLSADEVIRRIKERHANGQSLTDLEREDTLLYRSGKRAFSGWWAALQAAGLDELVPHQWSKRAVINAMLDRKRRGHSLTRTWKEDKPLFRAAVRYFGNWETAMRVAGLDPIRRERWSKRRVIERLQAWEERSDGRNLRDVDANLAAAAARLFGSYDAAVEAAGIEPSPRRWTDARVVAAIQDRYVKGHPLDVAGLGDIRLANAAKRRFGSWQAAVEAAGLAGKIVIKKPHRRWSQEAVISEIQSWHRSGRPFTDVRKQYQALQCAAKTWFGSWRAALIAAGFAPDRRSWSKQAIIDELHDRVRNDQSLSSGDPANRNLAAVAHRHFGSWRNAIRAAGVFSHQADRKGA